MAAALVHGIGATATPAPAAQPAVARVIVPSGSKQCPDSGPGASCSSGGSDPIDFGAATVPSGLTACPADPVKPIPSAPGACAPSAALAGAAAATIAPPISAAESKATSPPPPAPDLQLEADRTTVGAGDHTDLVAKSSLVVDGTPWAIEIFDQSTKALIGACSQAGSCAVAFSASAGTHAFVAFVTTPTAAMPTTGVRLTSNVVSVRWLGVRLSTSGPSVVGPNHPITFKAEASQDVTGTRYAIELWDTSTGQRLTYCSRGSTCSTALIEPGGGTHRVAADLGLVGPTPGLPNVLATSQVIAATWVTVDLTASTVGVNVTLTATASADLTSTPWAIYVYTADGNLVGSPCNARACTVSTPLKSGRNQSFYAAIEQRTQAGDASATPLGGVLQRVRASVTRPDVQAKSAPVGPTHWMWGVDSCKAFTQDPGGTTGLLPQVLGALGSPDFWGRYLPTTGNCPGVSSSEIAAAHARHMAILPIWNNYDCSNVSGNAAGSSYGLAALQYAQNDMIPMGTAIAIDIEPPGDACPGAANVDFAFIAGWYDVLTRAGYVPAFYGNTSAGSAFAAAWCSSVQQRPEIANNSYLWSFEPSLQGGYSKGDAPAFGPYYAGCAGKYVVWQYMLSAGSTPDVDHDEASSVFPFWYP